MTTSLTLNEDEIKEAIAQWLTTHKGFTGVADLIICIDPGDPPLSGQRIYAKVVLKEAPQ